MPQTKTLTQAEIDSIATLQAGIFTSHRTVGSTLNQWYTTAMTLATLTTGTPSANTLYACPLVISKNQTIDQMAINVTTGGASSTPRIGIYRDDGTIYPGSLLVDAGTQDGSGIAVLTYTANLPVDLTPGLYWLAYITNATAPIIRCPSISNLLPVMGYANTLPTNPQGGWSASYSFGTLPSTFPAGASIITAAPIPGVFVRFSA